MTCLLILCIWGHGLQVNGSEVTLKGSESAWVHLQRCAYTWALGVFQLNLLGSSRFLLFEHLNVTKYRKRWQVRWTGGYVTLI